MLLALFAEIMGARTVAGFVRLVRAVETCGAFGGFLAREIAEAVILGFGVRGGVIEGYGFRSVCRVAKGRCRVARGAGGAAQDLRIAGGGHAAMDVPREPNCIISIAIVRNG